MQALSRVPPPQALVLLLLRVLVPVPVLLVSRESMLFRPQPLALALVLRRSWRCLWREGGGLLPAPGGVGKE